MGLGAFTRAAALLGNRMENVRGLLPYWEGVKQQLSPLPLRENKEAP